MTCGTETGTTLFEAALRAPVHAPLTAATLKVYPLPFVSQFTVIGLSNHVKIILPGEPVST